MGVPYVIIAYPMGVLIGPQSCPIGVPISRFVTAPVQFAELMLYTSSSTELLWAVELELWCTYGSIHVWLKRNPKLSPICETQCPGNNTNCEVKPLHNVPQLRRAEKKSPLLLLNEKLKNTIVTWPLSQYFILHKNSVSGWRTSGVLITVMRPVQGGNSWLGIR